MLIYVDVQQLYLNLMMNVQVQKILLFVDLLKHFEFVQYLLLLLMNDNLKKKQRILQDKIEIKTQTLMIVHLY
jgi:hypothetical protein